MYFTGSKEHNIVMRQRAIAARPAAQRIRPVPVEGGNARPEAARAVPDRGGDFCEAGSAYVPPELREDNGEFAAAEKGTAAAPDRVDGSERLAAQSLHLERRPQHARGDRRAHARTRPVLIGRSPIIRSRPFRPTASTPRALRQQLKEIKQINEKLADEGSDFRLLTGTEVDILKDGLDFADDLLAELDVVVASMHVPANNEAETTKRLIRAAENQLVHMLGHLTGRLLLEREPYKVNQQAVIDACAETGTGSNSTATRSASTWTGGSGRTPRARA